MFTATLFTIAKTWKQPKCPSMDEWIKKMWYIYIYNFFICTYTHTQEYDSAIKRREFYHLQQHGWTYEGIMLSEISQRKTNTV